MYAYRLNQFRAGCWIQFIVVREHVSSHSSKSIFILLSFSGYAEFSLPVRVTGVQSIGMPLDEVTLYEHMCVHLCATVATTPAKHFGTLVYRHVCIGIIHVSYCRRECC